MPSEIAPIAMPKQLPSDLLERVISELADHARGRGLAQLQALLKGVASRRTLRRRLDEWVREGAIRAEGIRRGRRYFALAARAPISAPPARDSTGAPANLIPLSGAGRALQVLVRHSIADRARGNVASTLTLKRSRHGALLSWSFTTLAVGTKNIMNSVPRFMAIESAFELAQLSRALSSRSRNSGARGFRE